MEQQTILMIGLAGLALCAGVFVAFPSMFADDKGQKRAATIVASGPKRVIADRSADQAARRKQVADSLKEIEHRTRSKKVSLEARLLQAGLDWTRKRYFITSAVLGIVPAVAAFVLSASPLLAVLVLFVGGLGVPKWYIAFLRRRRLKKFRNLFPEAIDVIIRGVKAGLPLGDCLRIIATESQEPIRSEFRQITQAQTLGLPLGEAVEKLAERVPSPEANFFAIVIAIQQKAGGNLSEALGNLSRVLRERKKMEGKIRAMSQEAKSSAAIIGALPIVVGFFVWLVSPRYIELMWITSTGRLAMAACAIWMGIGIAVIKKMISFDF